MSLSNEVNFVNVDEELLLHNKCDKYDYLTAVGCGVIAGAVDVLFVGTPTDSALGRWTDTQTDNFVKLFARKNGWNPGAGNEDNVTSAIGFLEKKFKVNYDQRHSGDVDNMFDMSTKNHHLKSLAHSPSPVGLFFSILNQFTSTSTFLSGGALITIKTDTFELQGSNLISKLFCGCANWFGHIVSDMAGSSGGRGNGGRGSGVPIPFYELFQLCNFGEFQIGKDRQDLATLATRVFQEGYDLRFGAAMAIPVVLSELLIRLIWALKRFFYHELPFGKCIPLVKHQNLRTMLIVGHGTLCVIDAVDAGIRSNGNALSFALRLNLIAWYRLITLVLKEVFIRLGIAADAQQSIESYRIVNEQLQKYIIELEKIDIERFRKETELYENMVCALESATDTTALNIILVEQTKALNLAIPWGEDFDGWMRKTDEPLVIE